MKQCAAQTTGVLPELRVFLQGRFRGLMELVLPRPDCEDRWLPSAASLVLVGADVDPIGCRVSDDFVTYGFYGTCPDGAVSRAAVALDEQVFGRRSVSVPIRRLPTPL